MAQVFNKSALERLSSPEQLDRAICVTSPASWLALIGVTVILGAVLAWAVLGRLPVTVEAPGIVTSEAAPDGQMAECYLPYSEAGQVQTGMNAVVYDMAGEVRYDAEVTGLSFDDTAYSGQELVLGGQDIAVAVSLRIPGGGLPAKTMITANIITGEYAPLRMLMRGM